ncbi:MAG: hypothetical protein KDC07_01475 [Chitinophagaceae bacterium]|nr:hypothetical protein [Chitinophagaceae bacterium]
MKKLIYLLAGAILTGGCTKKVDSNDLKDDVPYYQVYEVAYNKTDNSTNATAGFQVRDKSGAKVLLSDGASVRANNMTANTSSIDKTRYTWALNGMPDVDFALAKNSGDTITNVVLKSDIGDVEIVGGLPSSVSKSNGFDFSWAGAALAGQESMTVSVVSGIATDILTRSVTNNTVTITADDLKNCPTGNISVVLTRTKDMPVKKEDGGAGGSIQVRLTVSAKTVLN